MRDDSLEWVDASGDVYPLVDQDDIAVEWGVRGRLMASFTFTEEPFATEHGTRIVDVRAMPRDIALVATIKGSDNASLRAAVERYGWAFNPTRGDGRLRTTRPDGIQRELVCRYRAGLEGDESIDNGILAFQTRAALIFRAVDPFWREVTTNSWEWSPGNPGGTWFPWSFPIYLASSSVVVQDTVDNYGQYPAWPIWTITGPGSDLKITYTSADGEPWLGLGYELEVGEVVTIDTTRPGNKTVTSSTAGNLFGKLTGVMRPIDAGLASVHVEYSGADEAQGSRVQLQLQRRFNAP